MKQMLGNLGDLYFIFSAPPPPFKKRSRTTASYFAPKSSKVASRIPLPPAAGNSTHGPTVKIYGFSPAVINTSDSSGWLLSLDHVLLPRNCYGLPCS